MGNYIVLVSGFDNHIYLQCQHCIFNIFHVITTIGLAHFDGFEHCANTVIKKKSDHQQVSK